MQFRTKNAWHSKASIDGRGCLESHPACEESNGNVGGSGYGTSPPCMFSLSNFMTPKYNLEVRSLFTEQLLKVIQMAPSKELYTVLREREKANTRTPKLPL